MDEHVAAVQRRGLPAVQLSPLRLGAGALEPELAQMGQFDTVVYYAGSSAVLAPGQQADGGSGLAGSWWRQESLAEIGRVLKQGGKLCVQAPLPDEAAVREQLALAGFAVLAWERAAGGSTLLLAAC